MKLSSKVLQSFVDNYIETDDLARISVKKEFINNFSGNKRIKMKRAKQMIHRIFSEVILPKAREIVNENS